MNRNYVLPAARCSLRAARITVAAFAFGATVTAVNAGTSDTFKTGSSLLTPGSYGSGNLPGNTTDVTLTTTTTTLTITGGALTMESLTNASTTKYTITNSATGSTGSTLTLGNNSGFTNANDSGANDLIALSSSGTLTFSNGSTGALGIVLASSGNFANNSTASTGLTISANISGAQTLTLSGIGTSSFTGTNTFSALAITAGELDVSADTGLGAVPTAATQDITINGGRLGSNSGTVFTVNQNRVILLGSAAGTSFSVKSGTGDVTYNGSFQDLSTGGVLVKQGAGILDLGGVSTYTGATSINNGTIRLNGANLLPAATTLSLGQTASVNLGTFDLNGNTQTVAGLNSVVGANASTTLKNTVTSTNAATLTINGGGFYGNGSITNSGVIAGAVSIVKTGSGTQTFGDNNTYTGSTTVNGGTLIVGTPTTPAAKALGGTSGVFVNNGGTLQMGAANQFNASTPAPVQLSGTVTSAATFSVNGNSQGSTTANGVGALTLAATSANNVVDFGQKAGVATFLSFTPNGSVLNVNNYIGNGSSGGTDQLIFNADQSAQLNNFDFGFGPGTDVAEQMVGTGFYEVYSIVPVPEPATVFGGVLLVGALGWNQRRHLRGLSTRRRLAA